jgi:hypothetical protein
MITLGLDLKGLSASVGWEKNGQHAGRMTPAKNPLRIVLRGINFRIAYSAIQ